MDLETEAEFIHGSLQVPVHQPGADQGRRQDKGHDHEVPKGQQQKKYE
jgi:hypothetical protein